MASNETTGDGHRIGAVKNRSQLKTPVMGERRFMNWDKNTGQLMDQKEDGEKFKGVLRGD